jgi:exonuclease VII large subunit
VQGTKCAASVATGIKFFNSPFFMETQNDNDNINGNSNDNINDSDDPFAMSTTAVKSISQKKQFIKKCNTLVRDDGEKVEEEVEVDLIVVTRGGGSFEDLMGFSQPKVINAIYASKKYIISAVGHEIDNMLSDYVANYRAPTPSIAGEVVCSANNNNKKKIRQLGNRITKQKNDITQELYKIKNSIKKIMLGVVDPTEEVKGILNHYLTELKTHIRDRIYQYQHKICIIKEALIKNDVSKILTSGFTILTTIEGDIIRSADVMFDRSIIMIHNTGRYEVSIHRNDSVVNKSDENTLVQTPAETQESKTPKNDRNNVRGTPTKNGKNIKLKIKTKE